MQGKCRMKNALYKCIASTPTKPQRIYLGKSEDEWKKRYYNHMNHSEKNVRKMNPHSVVTFGK